MPIKVIRETDTGLAYPAILCDVCGDRINDASAGNYHWNDEQGDIAFCHKRCERKAVLPRFWQPLTAFVTFLGRNLNLFGKLDDDQLAKRGTVFAHKVASTTAFCPIPQKILWGIKRLFALPCAFAIRRLGC